MKIPLFAVVVPFSLAACTGTSAPDAFPASSAIDPALGIWDTHYHPVVVNYTHREPVEPENWRRL
ncbi:MAG TPA: hypothetical protein VK862_01805, partial [Afifellaceae bacterium]|nr:hypothetical protein [Afifellaceae bacterium]